MNTDTYVYTLLYVCCTCVVVFVIALSEYDIAVVQDKIVSYAKRNSRKQLLEALQPFQAQVSPDEEGNMATQVEVEAVRDGSGVEVVSGAAPSLQVSNDLSATTETDTAQQDFDRQSLTEEPASTPKPEPAPLRSFPSVSQQRHEILTERRAPGRNEVAAPNGGQSGLRSQQGLLELLRQHPELLDQRRDQLNITHEVCTHQVYCSHLLCESVHKEAQHT